MYPWRSGIDASPSGRWQVELTLSITDVDELFKCSASRSSGAASRDA